MFLIPSSREVHSTILQWAFFFVLPEDKVDLLAVNIPLYMDTFSIIFIQNVSTVHHEFTGSHDKTL